jgi:hypothetical protein
MIRNITLAALFVGIVGTTWAEPIRTTLTKENKFPGKYHLEVGGLFDYVEYDSSGLERQDISPYARFGLAEHVALFGVVPFRSVEDDMPDIDESGLGDVRVGIEFRAFEDIFTYPWIIPHASVTLDTGDEDDGLGQGDTSYQIGLALGTTVYDVLHYALDLRYEFLDEEIGEDIASGALSLVWDLDDRFALIFEAQLSDEDDGMGNDNPVIYLGGFHYVIAEDLTFGVEMGTASDSDIDVVAAGRVTYTF